MERLVILLPQLHYYITRTLRNFKNTSEQTPGCDFEENTKQIYVLTKPNNVFSFLQRLIN